MGDMTLLEMSVIFLLLAGKLVLSGIARSLKKAPHHGKHLAFIERSPFSFSLLFPSCMTPSHRHFLFMGVSGCGKTTVGRRWAEHLGICFLDADDFHPPRNREKMSSGIPLSDADRMPWLDRIAEELQTRANQGAVLACSALKEIYRCRLIAASPALNIMYLQGDREILLQRMKERKNHFMPSSLLDSQLATLEAPERALCIDISHSLESIHALLQLHFSTSQDHV